MFVHTTLPLHITSPSPFPAPYLPLSGVRPWDPVTAVWTFEAWVKVGSPAPSSSAASGGGAAGDDNHIGHATSSGNVEDEEGEGGGASNSGSAGVVLERDVTIASHGEWFAAHPSSTSAASPASAYTLRPQWTLAVTPAGALVFTAFPFASPTRPACPPTPKTIATAGAPPVIASPLPEGGVGGGGGGGGTLTSPSSVSSAAGSVRLGEWTHVALVVDGSAAAREVAGRLKATYAGERRGRMGSQRVHRHPLNYVRIGLHAREFTLLLCCCFV